LAMWTPLPVIDSCNEPFVRFVPSLSLRAHGCSLSSGTLRAVG
jgi:hypothetical protein